LSGKADFKGTGAGASKSFGFTAKRPRSQRVAEKILNGFGQGRMPFRPYRQLSGSNLNFFAFLGVLCACAVKKLPI
jgi:hypothetical protein